VIVAAFGIRATEVVTSINKPDNRTKSGCFGFCWFVFIVAFPAGSNVRVVGEKE
jgi:hypothetical protein